MSIETCAQNRLKPSGSAATTARSGSARAPGRGCTGSAGSGSDVRVTSGRPSSPMPPIDSVTQVGSPENSSSYSGVRRKRTIAQLDHEVVDQLLGAAPRSSTPSSRSRCEVDVQERRGAAERHRGAVLLLDRGEVGEVEPLHGLVGGRRRARRRRSRSDAAISFSSPSARICSASSSRSRMTSSVERTRVELGALGALGLDQRGRRRRAPRAGSRR